MPPTPKKRGRRRLTALEVLPVPEDFLEAGMLLGKIRWQRGSNEGCTGSTHWGTDCAANTLQEREGRDAVGSGH